jgi:hypothetical protein
LLDEIVDENGVDVAVVEKEEFDVYKRRKPGRARDLRATQLSEAAPLSIIYNTHRLSRERALTLQQQLLRAHDRKEGNLILMVGGFANIRAYQFDPVSQNQTAGSHAPGSTTPPTRPVYSGGVGR